MLKHPKAKGTRLEKETVDSFIAAGYPSERMWGSNGASRGLHQEVDVLVKDIEGFDTPMKIQCKFVAKLGVKYKPSEYVDATVFRENRGEHYIMIKLDDFIKRFL